MELTNGSDLILVLKIEDKKGEKLRVKDCTTFKVRVFTTNRADNLQYSKLQINQDGEYDTVAINARDLEQLQSGVICYDYDYSKYDPRFEQDMKYDKVKTVVTDFYWRNTGGNFTDGEVTVENLNRLYDKLAQEEDERMSADNKLAQAIDWLNLNACLKGHCSTIYDKEGNIIREFVVGEDVDPVYTQAEIDEMLAVINDHIDEVEEGLFSNIKEVETNLFNNITEVETNLEKNIEDVRDGLFGNIEEVQKNLVETVATVQQGLHNEIVDELNRATAKEAELESKHNQDIAETLKDSKQYTDDKVKDLQHNVEDNYYNRQYIDNLEDEVYKDIAQTKTDANKYTDNKYNSAIQYVDSNLINYYTREEADNLHSNVVSDVNNKFLNYYKKNETDALLEALEGEIDNNLKNYYTKPQVNNLIADVEEKIPTAVSELDNDLGFLTRHQSLALYAKTADVQKWLKDSEDYVKEYFQPKGDYATVANVKYMIERLINMAPDDLDTLGEIAEKLKSNDDLHASIIDLLRRKANADLVYTKSETDKMFRDAVLEIQNGFTLELVNYYTKEEADLKFATKADIPSLSGYATEQWVRNQNYLTEHQDLSAYALKSYVDQKVSEGINSIPEFDGYTKAESDGKYALKSEIPSLDGYSKTSEVQQMIETAVQEIPEVDAYTKSESDAKYQLKGNYTTEEWVENKGYLTEIPDTVATKEYVNQEITKAVTGGEVDLSDYLTKNEAQGTYQKKADAVKIWSGSQSQYNQLGSYDNNTVYVIIG